MPDQVHDVGAVGALAVPVVRPSEPGFEHRGNRVEETVDLFLDGRRAPAGKHRR